MRGFWDRYDAFCARTGYLWWPVRHPSIAVLGVLSLFAGADAWPLTAKWTVLPLLLLGDLLWVRAAEKRGIRRGDDDVAFGRAGLWHRRRVPFAGTGVHRCEVLLPLAAGVGRPFSSLTGRVAFRDGRVLIGATPEWYRRSTSTRTLDAGPDDVRLEISRAWPGAPQLRVLVRGSPGAVVRSKALEVATAARAHGFQVEDAERHDVPVAEAYPR